MHLDKSSNLIACHECDLLHTPKPVLKGEKAFCSRCGAFLYKFTSNSIERALALNLTAFILFIMANVFPFISIKISGRIEENIMISGVLALCREGRIEVAVLVFFTSFLNPLLTISGTLYILIPLIFGYRSWNMAYVYRMVRALTPWSLIGIFMLGLLIAIFKLLKLATIIPGISLFSFVALIVVTTAAKAGIDTSLIWLPMKLEPSDNDSGNTANSRNLICCHICYLLVPQIMPDNKENHYCPRCKAPLHRRKVNSLTRTWALIMTASILLIPANIYPVMTVIRFGIGAPDTILSGVVHLIKEGMWPLAMIVFFASIVVPFMKLIILSFLLITVQKKSSWRPRDRAVLYRITEEIGAWSMIDIFLLAILTALVNMGALAAIKPGAGASFFGAAVVITMIAAHSFDPRLIWDNTK